MISYSAALKLVLDNTKTGGSEYVSLGDSFQRTIAEDLHSNLNIPPFKRVSMDGFAVRSHDLGRLPCILELIHTLRAGEVFKRSVKKGEAVRIMTGCALPDCFDRVIKVEDTIEISPNKIKIIKLSSERNFCTQGEDCKKGDSLVKKGQIIGAAQISLLATSGKIRLRVYRRPKIAILSTGDELVEPDKKLKFGKIRNSNAWMLTPLLENAGANVNYLGIVKDDVDAIKDKIRIGLSADILIISGGVSMGEFDFIPKALNELGVRKIFHKVSIKPGKPLWFGKKGKTLVFGVPGNPVSTYVAFLLFLRPVMLKMQGNAGAHLKFLSGKLVDYFQVSTDRLTFLPCKISQAKAYFKIKPLEFHSSADMSAVSKSHGFFVCQAGRYLLKKNMSVRFIFR